MLPRGFKAELLSAIRELSPYWQLVRSWHGLPGGCVPSLGVFQNTGDVALGDTVRGHAGMDSGWTW